MTQNRDGLIKLAAAPISRRSLLGETAALLATIGISGTSSSNAAAAQEASTDWGWPQPYRRISTKSVEWLKAKGWWPLQVAWNPLWSDGNLILFVMQHQKLLEARGLEADYKPFLAAGQMNEVFVPGRIQIAQAGSLGLLRLIDLKVPTAIVLSYGGQRQAFLVPTDSPLKSLSDLKDARVLGRPAEFAVTVGSTTHLGLLLAAKVLELKEGRDFVIRNMGPADIIPMPKGIDVAGMWEPNVVMMTEFLKNARILELVDKYEIYSGYSYLRGELEAEVPDVVQAYTDAFIEARLLTRLKPQEILSAFTAHDSQRGRDPKLIQRDAEIHILNPAPTVNYPFENTRGFWIPLDTFHANVLADAGVLRQHYTEADFASVFKPKYFAETCRQLGWAIPRQPAFLPQGWKGVAGHPPYPDYGYLTVGKEEFPGRGDLTRAWTFGGKTFQP